MRVPGRSKKPQCRGNDHYLMENGSGCQCGLYTIKNMPDGGKRVYMGGKVIAMVEEVPMGKLAFGGGAPTATDLENAIVAAVDRYQHDLLIELHALRARVFIDSVPGSHQYDCWIAGLDHAIEIVKGTNHATPPKNHG